ncbi:hypothetical protein OsJ_32386 [Oryza sativa Japonica Group]|uniref:Uncharacterized protein n=1 Tax=Oryza sativa subsp. japonica TaxID=39947 RepID=A3C744_ORYSJ|nr:hypothetical protein OsJ_32386 [Oryza sativa Japonica Group]
MSAAGSVRGRARRPSASRRQVADGEPAAAERHAVRVHHVLLHALRRRPDVVHLRVVVLVQHSHQVVREEHRVVVTYHSQCIVSRGTTIGRAPRNGIMAAAATTNKLQTMRWSDLDEDDDYGGGGDLSTLLPPRVVIGPDENGIRRVPLQRGGESGEGDNDTVFFPDNLVAVLNKYDHAEMYYVGAPSESVE